MNTGAYMLRPITEADLPQVFAGLSHPQVIKYYGVSYDTLEATRQQMKYYDEVEKNGTGIYRAICSPDNRIFYGVIGLYHLNRIHKKAEIGFWLMPEFQGKGIMPKVALFYCHYGFQKLNLHRIEALVETENQACIRLVDKVGFQLEGTMRNCEIKNGKYISLHIFSRLSTDPFISNIGENQIFLVQ